jgi:hypothetical protein
MLSLAFPLSRSLYAEARFSMKKAQRLQEGLIPSTHSVPAPFSLQFLKRPNIFSLDALCYVKVIHLEDIAIS